MSRAGVAAIAAAAGLWFAAPRTPAADDDARAAAARALAERLAVIERTDAAITRKRDARRGRLEARVRALYKLERGGRERVWVDAEERELAVWRRMAARRLIRRGAREIELLGDEREAMVRARLALIDALGDLATATVPEPASLAAPVEGEVVSNFGRRWDDDASARLSRRGVELSSSPGQTAAATSAGEVLYAGAVRNLGDAVIVEHDGGLRSVVASLDELAVAAGDAVERGDPLGRAAGESVYLEIRLPIGAEGFPIDPEPLLIDGSGSP